jgi:hypothetical protein
VASRLEFRHRQSAPTILVSDCGLGLGRNFADGPPNGEDSPIATEMYQMDSDLQNDTDSTTQFGCICK